ncbi:hypothetical protein SAMN04487820_102420 [Actinopolyspora mzabensis]|uniref:Uncharacterized protein n=1 Tax=Actinopolyspora mzabensis TaxID=995066 RepID=A0A1G8X9B1_ACTMZ|nr:hypothetical protein [Actinopolyspora mzabensis]SDJ86330.1 hypothetical protein SAMN04487820_102420 [Actinopolyspora mzabensis]
MSTHPAMLLTTAIVLAATAIVLGGWGNRASYRPRHAGGSGPAARRLAALRLEHHVRDERPTTELIGWPLCDPDEHPHLFHLDPPAPVLPKPIPAQPAAPLPTVTTSTTAPEPATDPSGTEHPELALMRRVLNGLHRL